MARYLLFLLLLVQQSFCLIPPRFQWKTIDFAWESKQIKDVAIDTGDFITENNIPTGIVRWRDKLFVTIPRWKKGVPSSLNFVYVNGTQEQPLQPYPNWAEAFIPQQAESLAYNSTVVCAFRAHVDCCNRLWVVDNGVSDITGDAKQLTKPAVLIFDLRTNHLLHKYELGEDVLRDSSVFTSIVVDVVPNKGRDCSTSYAYITDMGSNAIVVYSLKDKQAWRVENPYFHFDPHAGVYKVGGIDFYWSDGISSAALSKLNNHGCAHKSKEGGSIPVVLGAKAIKLILDRRVQKLLQNQFITILNAFSENSCTSSQLWPWIKRTVLRA